MSDNSTDKALLLILTGFMAIVSIYTKDAQMIGGFLVISGITARALASRVQVGKEEA